METLWYWLVAVLVAAYVVMDGFDLGAGALHFLVAKTDRERREVLGAIGPYWDGNEVWLLAAGGSLLLAFPRVLAAGFSGFYLAMFLVLWFLLLRGIAIEFRSHLSDDLWRDLWDAGFCVSSAALPVLLGVALGNVLRGVPLDATGYFELPLWTNLRTAPRQGLLDWYTLLVGLFALLALCVHGALFLAWKTQGPVHERAATLVKRLALPVAVSWAAVTAATLVVTPALVEGVLRAPLAWLSTAVLLAGLAAVAVGVRRKRYLLAFLGSAAFLLGVLAATAAAVHPVMLRSTLDPAFTLSADNSASAAAGLGSATVWWFLALLLVLAYYTNLFRAHRGKVKAAEDGEGY
jgi:cytochrome d ubiquinol oxidase subunit II